ncbi:hypothetical protein M2366_001545 [Aeromonas sp. BIGb0405]|uniref:hypothetical protein n=1 Tax=Aeromonas sp. BIGb0405 TaxID=2940592 RepID=UPI002167C29E|nr:hypothetical protein [Aeromonas sp. BIGb0405]MCS3455478.1 hypothetical protein [Aeromonas sp. BIGb0405]
MSQKWSMQGALNMAGALLLRETVEQVKQREQAADATRKAQQLGRKLAALRTLNDGQRKTPLNGAVTPSGVSKSAYEGLI